MSGQQAEIIAVGRIGVDFYASEEGRPLKDVRTFSRTQGGSISNIAVNLAKLGHAVKLITRVGDEPLGWYLLDYLGRNRVDTSSIRLDPQHRTSLAVVEVFPPDSFVTLFFRENCADLHLTLDDIPFDEVARARILAASGTSLTRSPARETILYVLQKTAFASEPKPTVVFDLDYREVLWGSRQEAALYLWQAVKLADIVLANDEEIEVLSALCDREQVVEQILAGRRRILVHKRGMAGATIYAEGQQVTIPPFPATRVVSTNGAGDAFAAAFLHGLLAGLDLYHCGVLGSAAGAIVVSRVGCSEAMPTLDEIEGLVTSTISGDSTVRKGGGLEHGKKTNPNRSTHQKRGGTE